MAILALVRMTSPRCIRYKKNNPLHLHIILGHTFTRTIATLHYFAIILLIVRYRAKTYGAVIKMELFWESQVLNQVPGGLAVPSGHTHSQEAPIL